jgi:hypothetical protein
MPEGSKDHLLDKIVVGSWNDRAATVLEGLREG